MYLAKYLACFFLTPGPYFRLAAGGLTKATLSDEAVARAVKQLIRGLGSDVNDATDLLATSQERAMARAHAPVFEYEKELSWEDSPVLGSGHCLDWALACAPLPGSEGARKYRRVYFGREEMDERMEALAAGLRGAIVAFARDRAPGDFHGVPWLHAGEKGGQMIVCSTPRFDGPSEKRELVAKVLAAAV